MDKRRLLSPGKRPRRPRRLNRALDLLENEKLEEILCDVCNGDRRRPHVQYKGLDIPEIRVECPKCVDRSLGIEPARPQRRKKKMSNCQLAMIGAIVSLVGVLIVFFPIYYA
eukprot:scpid103409/ scgid32324/ 